MSRVDWPNDPGFYWFFGKRTPASNEEVHFGKAIIVPNGEMMFTIGGSFMFKGQAEGTFISAMPPRLRDIHIKPIWLLLIILIMVILVR